MQRFLRSRPALADAAAPRPFPRCCKSMMRWDWQDADYCKGKA